LQKHTNRSLWPHSCRQESFRKPGLLREHTASDQKSHVRSCQSAMGWHWWPTEQL